MSIKIYSQNFIEENILWLTFLYMYILWLTVFEKNILDWDYVQYLEYWCNSY